MQLNINGDFLGRFAHFKKKLYLCSKFILHDSKQLSLKQFAYLCEKMGGGRGPPEEMESIL